MSTFKNNKNKPNSISLSKKISFSSIMCALSVIMLFIGSVIEVVDITSAAMASFVVVVTMIELGSYYPVLLYFATSVLSFLLLPNKLVVFMYMLFFGFYPILKRYIERLKPISCIAAKFLVFNAIIFVYCFLAEELLLAEVGNVKIYLIILLNVICFTLDFALTLFVTAYVKKFRRVLRIHRFFK